MGLDDFFSVIRSGYFSGSVCGAGCDLGFVSLYAVCGIDAYVGICQIICLWYGGTGNVLPVFFTDLSSGKDGIDRDSPAGRIAAFSSYGRSDIDCKRRIFVCALFADT